MALPSATPSEMIVPCSQSNESKAKQSLHGCFRRTDDFGACLATVDEIRKILIEYPESVQQLGPCEKYGFNLPLHTALDTLGETPFEVIELLVKTYPNAVYEEEQFQGCLPIHVACENGADIRILELLYRAFPKSIDHKDHSGWTPFQYACCPNEWVKSSRKSEMIRFFLRKFNIHPTRLDAEFIRYCPMEMDIIEQITMMTSCVPNHLRHRDYLPHALCCIPTGSRAFQYLLEATTCVDEECDLNILDSEGNNLLHTFINVANFTVYDFIDDITDMKTLLKILQDLCRMNPDWLRETNMNGELPLHRACQKNRPPQYIQTLLEFYPSGVDQCNNAGQLPIHLLVENGGNLEAMELVIAYSRQELLGIPDPTTNLVPFMKAAVNNEVPLDTVLSLLRKDPSQLSQYTFQHKSKRRKLC